MYKDNKSLVEEYTNKNENLLKQLEKYQKYPEEVKLLNENMINLQKVNTDLNGKILIKSQLNDDLINKSNELNSKLTNVKIEHDEEITKFVVAAENIELQYKNTIKQKYDENIIAVKKLIEDNSREKDAEKRDELLSLKEAQQTKLLLIQDEYAAKINDYQTNYRLFRSNKSSLSILNEFILVCKVIIRLSLFSTANLYSLSLSDFMLSILPAIFKNKSLVLLFKLCSSFKSSATSGNCCLVLSTT